MTDEHIKHGGEPGTEDTTNQPALADPRTYHDYQRDLGSGLNAGTDSGATGIRGSAEFPSSEDASTTRPGADPHAGVGNGEGMATGQFRDSDDGTTV